MKFPRWSPSVQAGSVYNFDTGLSGGNSFEVNRYYIEGGLTRMWNTRRMISISGGYGQEDYHFDDSSTEPWNNIDSYRIGMMARWALNEEWMILAIPSLQSYVETGAELDDGLGGSMILGAGYQYRESLFLGPALGFFGRREESPLIIPILLIDWKITEQLSLGTGRGFAATAGPGLGLTYEFNKNWKMGLSGRYENFRFRLSSENDVSDGIGEDRYASFLGSFTYELYPRTYATVLMGVKFAGKMAVEDDSGREVSVYRYDEGVFGGFLIGVSF